MIRRVLLERSARRGLHYEGALVEALGRGESDGWLHVGRAPPDKEKARRWFIGNIGGPLKSYRTSVFPGTARGYIPSGPGFTSGIASHARFLGMVSMLELSAAS